MTITDRPQLTINDLRGRGIRRTVDKVMKAAFLAASVISVVISALILVVLVRGALDFLNGIDWDWANLNNTGWFPRRSRFDLRTIVAGSIVMGLVAMFVAVPFGLATAIYLAEYAPSSVRNIVKPVIEVLAGIPSVVVGLFVINFVAPEVVSKVFDPTSEKNMLAAGLGIGILVIPIMASVSEDALASVPDSLREASYGCGARKLQTTLRVVLPSSISGLVAAFIISVSRAIGETMVATMAAGYAGQGPYNGFNPLNPGLSVTGAMTNAVGGTDSVKGGPSYQVLFFIGLVLFLTTLVLNLAGDRFVQRVRHKY